MKILILERLSEKTLSDHASLIGGADVRIVLTVASGSATAETLEQSDWWVENIPLFEAAAARHARWVDQLVEAQKRAGTLTDTRSGAFIAYGLEVRLRYSVLAQAYLGDAAKDNGCRLPQIDVDVVSDDPYLRDTFASRGVIRQFRSVTLHRMTATRSWTTGLRERVGASPSIRKLVVAQRMPGSRSPALTGHETAATKDRTVALFVQSQHYLNLFRPIREKLLASGWRVRGFSYHKIEDGEGHTESFAGAARRAPSNREALRMPEWALTNELLAESPVSEAWLRVALDASWLTGWEQVVQHRRLLAVERPKVVISYTIDAVALGLQAAAESLGIPSLFINHGPQGPVWSSWFFGWTASAMAGQPCVDANTLSPSGERNRGLVSIGHPPYDVLLARGAHLGNTRLKLDDLGQPAERPYIVLAFAECGDDFWIHALQRRLLQMIAAVLPSDCYLVCKLHPAGDAERIPCQQILASALPSQAFVVIGERQHSTPDLLEACHVAVATERCMALTDAIVMGRAAIGIRFAEIPPGSSNLNHPARGPEFRTCCRVVQDTSELREALVSLTRNAAAREALLKDRERYLERFYVASDGGASDRLAGLIEHLGEGRSVESFAFASRPSVLKERPLCSDWTQSY